MTAKILSEFKQQVADLKLIPSGGGCFELTADGELVYSKLKTGRFPDENEILSNLSSRLKPLAR